MKDALSNVWKGVCIGIVDVIPGVSGATVALILGIYERIIRAIRKIELRFLLNIGIGIVFGWILGVHIILYLLHEYPSHLLAVYSGLILGSIEKPLRRCEYRNKLQILFGVLGFLVSFTLASMYATYENVSLPTWYVFICGIAALAAMLLPGISGSMVLLTMGAYVTIMSSVKSFFHLLASLAVSPSPENVHMVLASGEMSTLLVFGTGALVGIAITVLALSPLLKKFSEYMMPFFVGLILGSLRATFPPQISPQVIICFIASFLLIFTLIRVERKQVKP